MGADLILDIVMLWMCFVWWMAIWTFMLNMMIVLFTAEASENYKIWAQIRLLNVNEGILISIQNRYPFGCDYHLENMVSFDHLFISYSASPL